MKRRVYFPNGYGASIISNEFSYGGRDGLYELAVLKDNQGKWELCYDTPITNDVIGYLTWDEAEAYLGQIEALPKKEDL